MKLLFMHKQVVYRIAVVMLALLLSGCGANDVDEKSPTLTFAGLQSSVTTIPTRTLSGTVETGATIAVSVGETSDAATVNADGTWTHELTLAPGSSLVTVSASDARGNQNLFSLTLTYDAVSVETYTTPIPDTSLAVGGLIDPDLQASLALSVILPDGTELDPAPTAVVNDDTWSASLIGLQEGDNVLKATVYAAGITDPVEAQVTITVDATIPSVTIDQPITTVVVPSLTVTGSSELGATSVTTLPLPVGGAAVVDAGTGNWSASIGNLAIGKNPVTATVTANSKTATARTLLIVEQSPPLINNVSPATGQLDVASDAVVTVTFNTAMDAATIEAGFTLNNGAVPATVSYNETTKTATLTPVASLPAGIYTARLSTTITDTDGDPLKQPLSWNFTVK